MSDVYLVVATICNETSVTPHIKHTDAYHREMFLKAWVPSAKVSVFHIATYNDCRQFSLEENGVGLFRCEFDGDGGVVRHVLNDLDKELLSLCSVSPLLLSCIKVGKSSYNAAIQAIAERMIGASPGGSLDSILKDARNILRCFIED